MKIAVAAILSLLSISAQAELKWETQRQQFTYKPGEPVFRAQFGFINRGKTTTKITEVKSGCACCTSAKADKMVFAPGERGAIAVKVDETTAQNDDDSQAGPYEPHKVSQHARRPKAASPSQKPKIGGAR